MLQERPYQDEAYKAILADFHDHQKLLLVLPTGAGKTITFARVITACIKMRKRVLVLAHREELLEQAQDKLLRACGVESELEKAQHHASREASCVVSSVQTMCRPNRLESWGSDHFRLIIVDEAHRTLADSYLRILSHFGSAKVLGVTATPDRGDKRNLGQYYEAIAYEIGLKELIQQGYLCPIKVKTFPIDLKLERAKISRGDYDAASVGHILEPLLPAIADRLVNEIGDRQKILIFLPLCDISRQITAHLAAHGIPAEHVDGESKDRKDILTRFHTGETRVLCNAMLLTEGYDEPGIDCVVCLRPTKSRALYAQMIGRGTRVADGKDDLLILDPLWISEQHFLVKPAHLIAETPKDAAEITEALDEFDHIPGLDEMVDLIELTESVLEQRMKVLEEELARKSNAKAKRFDPITYAISVMDSNTLTEYEPTMRWERQAPTTNQLRQLTSEGFEESDITCRGHASKLLDKIFKRREAGLATTKQLFWLHKFRLPNANSFSFEEAGAELDRRFTKKNLN